MKMFKSCTVYFVLFMSNCLCIGQRRHLVFENSPVFKLVVGVGVPVKLNEEGKSLSWFTNLQAKYKLPENIDIFIPNGYTNGRSVKHHLNGDFFYEALLRIVRRLNPMATDEDFLGFICGSTHERPDDYPGLSEDIWTVIQQQIFKSMKFGIAGACPQNFSAIDGCHECKNHL